MTDRPWLKFYPSDWRGDPKLRMCSIAARGLWMEMICIMHEAEPYGHLLIDGNKMTDQELARALGMDVEEVIILIAELDKWNVFSRNKAGTIYSRRMESDEKKARIARENGKKGGNPSISKQKKKSGSVNQSDKGGDKAHIPETRDQIEEVYKYTSSDASGSDDDDEVWLMTDGIAYLKANGETEQGARSFIGEWLKCLPAIVIRDAIGTAQVSARGKPQGYITKILQDKRAEDRVTGKYSSRTRDESPASGGGYVTPWRNRLIGFRDKGFWLGQFGPKPDEPGCGAPKELLKEIMG